MGIFQKMAFRVTTFVLTIVDKYRLSYYKHLYQANLLIEDNIEFGPKSNIKIFPGGRESKLFIGKGCIFRQQCILSLDAKGVLTIADGNFFNNNCSITCLGKIAIGENNLFGENVKMYDHNHEYRNNNELVKDQGFKIGKITIGNNCWIGSNCVILNNVTIGNNVVIGANVLVYKSIPDNAIVRANASYDLIMDGRNVIKARLQ